VSMFLRDIRYALRAMRRSPLIFVLAMALLAIGIGGTTAVFAVLNSILLKPLPFANAARDAMIWTTQPQLKFLSRVPASAADFIDWQHRSAIFARMAAIDSNAYTLTGMGEPRQITAARVTSDFFPVLGVSARLGRTFVAEEDQPGRHVAVVSDRFCNQYFGANSNPIGKPLLLDELAYSIVGVMGPEFHFPEARSLPAYFEFPAQTDIWLPLGLSPRRLADRRSHDLAVLGLLKPGRTLEQARAEMTAIATAIQQEHPESAQWMTQVVSLSDQATSQLRTPLLILQCAMLSVLLIVCSNVAGLLLARGAARKREIAIRSATGASPVRIFVQLLTESVVLAITAGLFGVSLAYLLLSLLTRSVADLVPADHIRIDSAVLGFAVLASLGTGLIAGVMPAISSAHPDLAETLKEAGRGSSGGLRSQRSRSALVISQFAVAFLLCMSAGTLVRSYQALLEVSPGFRVSNIVTFELSLPERRYPEPESRSHFYEELSRDVSSITGVDAVGVVSYLPLKGEAGLDTYHVEGAPLEKPGSEPIVAIRMASPSYFKAMGIPLLEGRTFEDFDSAARPLVAVISRTMANSAWPNSSAIGKRLSVGSGGVHHGWEGKPVEVIGVVGDVKPSLDAVNRPQIYFAQKQIPWTDMALVVRTRLRPNQLIGPVKRAVFALDASQPILDVRSMQQWLNESVASRRYSTTVLGGFAAVAVLLAGIGLYGLLSYSVLQQRKHVAIRMSLGAQRSDIILWVMGRGAMLMAVGLTSGAILYWIGSRFLETFLFGVKSADFIAAFSALLLFTIVTVVSCYFPARKSAGLDPLAMLREE
jgi:putative ABC transport system permease protein